MKVKVNATQSNKKNILTLLEEMGCSLPCNCHGAHQCNGQRYCFDCSMIPTAPLEVELPATSQQIHSVALENLIPVKGPGDTLLIDLGTTTVALALIHRESGELRQSATFANPQSRYGSDVIARIQAASSGKGKELQASIRKQLEQEVTLLCQRNYQQPETIQACYIGGNTTMIHLLLGYDCTPLGHSPFAIQKNSPAPILFQACLVQFAPWISAFVGGDICAGLYACPMTRSQKTTLFVDLGTNGEMVLSHQGTFYTAATAAGPALEGNGLSCGCPGISGAIRRVSLRRLRPALETIDNLLPIGICGSGAISLCAELLRHEYLTCEGILTDRFPSEGLLLFGNSQEGSIRFTADDLRNVQLAIAAIAAGIDTLAQKAHILTSDIEQVYLGGGFGFYLSMDDCEALGLFSDIPVSRVKAMGNTCLRGLYQWAVSSFSLNVPSSCVSLNLAESSYFQKQFVYHMTYPDSDPRIANRKGNL